MNEKSYHHGDLRRALIETGIEFIKQEGKKRYLYAKLLKCVVSAMRHLTLILRPKMNL